MYGVGRVLEALMWVGLLVSLPWLYSPHWWRFGPWFSGVYLLLLFVVLAGVWVAVVVHELGHLVVALALRAKIRGFRIGAENALFRVTIRRFRLVIGSPFHGGAVHYEGASSAWKRASITLAGPLADLVLACVVLSVRWPVMPAFTQAFAEALALVGLRNLLPFRSKTGQLSDGARLLETRADVRARKTTRELMNFAPAEGADHVQRILTAYRKGDRATRTSIGRVARMLRAEGRRADLIELHRGLGGSPERMSALESGALAEATHSVCGLADLSQDDARLAEQRLDALLRCHDLDQQGETLARIGIALLWLRRGQYADVEASCRPVLALKELPPASRELVLAMVIVARQELRQPYADVYAEAVALGRDTDKALTGIRIIAGVGGAKGLAADLRECEANLDRPAQPERTNRLLAAYRDGDPTVRVALGHIGHMLRDEGRIAELLEIHAGVALPSSRWSALMHAMASLEDTVAYVPGLPPDVYDLAVTRVQWLLDNDLYEGQKGSVRRAGTRHTLAVLRLRQGRFDEVEPLCADSLAAATLPMQARAQILATIALARRAQGQPHEDQLA